MQQKKVSKKVALVSGGIVLLCLITILPLAVYSRYGSSPAAQKMASVLYFPAFVTWDPFSVFSTSQLQADVQAIKKFYESQDFSSVGMRVDFTTEDGKKRLLVRERGVMNKDIEDLVIEKIVRDNDVRITDAEVDQNVDRKLHEFGTGDRVKEDLERLYGWNLEEFKQKIVKPALYKERARQIFENRSEKTKDEVAYKKIQEAMTNLESGVSFAEVAKKYSEGATSGDGGDLGWISLSSAEPNLADAIAKMKIGERSDIVETSLGYHIVQLQEMRKESGTTLYHVNQIITRKETFSDWVGAFIKKARVWVFLPDYQWNAQTGYVEFSNPIMREFEAKNKNAETIMPSEGSAENVSRTDFSKDK